MSCWCRRLLYVLPFHACWDFLLECVCVCVSVPWLIAASPSSLHLCVQRFASMSEVLTASPRRHQSQPRKRRPQCRARVLHLLQQQLHRRLQRFLRRLRTVVAGLDGGSACSLSGAYLDSAPCSLWSRHCIDMRVAQGLMMTTMMMISTQVVGMVVPQSQWTTTTSILRRMAVPVTPGKHTKCSCLRLTPTVKPKSSSIHTRFLLLLSKRHCDWDGGIASMRSVRIRRPYMPGSVLKQCTRLLKRKQQTTLT